MASEYIFPLNLKYLFVNVFAGSPEIFTGLLFIGISILAGLFRMPNQIYALMIVLSGILLYGWIGGGFYVIIILLVGISVFWIIARIVKN